MGRGCYLLSREYDRMMLCQYTMGFGGATLTQSLDVMLTDTANLIIDHIHSPHNLYTLRI